VPAHLTTGVIWKRYKTNVREWLTQRLQRQTLSRTSTAKIQTRSGPAGDPAPDGVSDASTTSGQASCWPIKRLRTCIFTCRPANS
jgi:hypothetical protein